MGKENNMKNLFVLVFILAMVGCKNNPPTESNTTSIPFQGEWTRSFPLGQGLDSMAHIFYRIGSDSIQYEMNGMMALKYTIEMDTFITTDNRWIGQFNGQSYVIFIQPISADSINLFKKKVGNVATALSLPTPDKTAKSQFTSWNVFVRK